MVADLETEVIQSDKVSLSGIQEDFFPGVSKI